MSPERAKAILPFSPGKAASAGCARGAPREVANTSATATRYIHTVRSFENATL
jgi:hypothetical protein